MLVCAFVSTWLLKGQNWSRKKVLLVNDSQLYVCVYVYVYIKFILFFFHSTLVIFMERSFREYKGIQLTLVGSRGMLFIGPLKLQRRGITGKSPFSLPPDVIYQGFS